jgi:hypothetical protein
VQVSLKEFLNRGPDACVARCLALLAESGRIMEYQILAHLGSVQCQFLLQLLIDVPGVDEEHVGLLNLHMEDIRLPEREVRTSYLRRRMEQCIHGRPSVPIIRHQRPRAGTKERCG